MSYELKVEKGKQLLDEDYKNAEEPYQFLAHQFEMKKFVNDKNYKVKTPIHLDAHASAFQIISAITKNKFGLEQTNLLPTYNSNRKLYRNDFYTLISNEVLSNLKTQKLELLYNCEDHTLIDLQIELLNEFGRKISKTTLMRYSYGAKYFSIADEINVFVDSTSEVIISVIKLIIEEYKVQFSENLKFEKQIKQILPKIYKNNKFPSFITSDGFEVVCQKYKKKVKKIESNYIKLDNRKTGTSLNVNEDTDELDKLKITNGIQANIIQSIDAVLLRSVAVKMKNKGIPNSTFIHDSFGTSPNYVDDMLEIIKKSFIEIIQSDIAINIYEQFKIQALKPLKVDKRKKLHIQEKLIKQIEKHNSSINNLTLNIINDEFDVNSINNSKWAFS